MNTSRYIKVFISLLIGIPSMLSLADEAKTNDVGFDLQSVIEYDKLIDEKGLTACDYYFGWSGVEPIRTEEQRMYCGKYQFLYEHWSTVGIPKNILQFNEKWYPKFFGDELEAFGYFPDDNPKRIVTDIVPITEGQCIESNKICLKPSKGGCDLWKEVCVRTSVSNTWQEVFKLVQDDQLPVGFQLGPKRAFGFESAAFTCAGCHLGTLNDGRYAIGMANKNLNYGQVYAGFNTPLQASMIALGDVMNQPIIKDVITKIAVGIEHIPTGLVEGLQMHPGMTFNNPGTELSFSPEQYKVMMRDIKEGTCYYKDNGDLIRCDHRHEERGPEHYKAQAKAMFKQLSSEFDGITDVTKQDWTMAMKELLGDAYCMPWPLKPSAWDGDDSLPWGQYFVGITPEQTAKSMSRSCKGLRWNPYYWKEFVQYLFSMGSGSGAVAFPSLTDQEMMINAGFNVLDFLIPPQSDDGVYTISRIPNVVGIPSHDELVAHGNMKTESGEVTPMLSLAGNVTSMEKFVRGFILLSGSVDPRYVTCETPDIVGNWEAKPDETCEIIGESIEPLLEYILALNPPEPLGDPVVVNQQGKQLFQTQCASCHAGPKFETTGVFLFSEVENEGITGIESCPDGQLSVDWTDDKIPKAIYNNCRPAYDTSGSLTYMGFMGTDPTYSRIGNPIPATGKPGNTPELESDTVASQGVKGQRLVGVRYKSELFHHGQLHSLEDVLCSAGTQRETAAQRATASCLVYDLDSEEGLAAYKEGHPICQQEWFPYTGHEFGCDNNQSDKAAILEYLRSL